MKNERYGASIACLGVCFYIIGFCFRLQQDVPLIILALTGLISVSRDSVQWKQPVVIALGLFLLVGLVSMATSDDITRSWRMSLMFIPSLLIFMLLAQYFDMRDLHNLYWVLTLVGLCFSIILLWIALCNPQQEPIAWVRSLGSPIFIVPNDIIFIALLMPFSIALLLQRTSLMSAVAALLMLSILLGLLTIVIFQSRAALIAELVSTIIIAAILKPRYALLLGCGIIISLLIVDGLMGFPLIAKHGRVADTRFALWIAAWRMFLDTPFLGHGPHSFVLFYQSYLQTIKLPSWLPIDQRLIPWPHNLYLELLAEQGMAGLTSLIGLLTTLFLVAWRTLKIESGNIYIYAVCILASLTSYCVSAVFELTFLRQWVVVMLFLLSGIISILSTYENSQYEIN